MNDRLRHNFYKPHMPANFSPIVSAFSRSAKYNRKYLHTRELHLSSASGPLHYVAMEIVGRFLRTAQGSLYISVMMTDLYFMLSRAFSKPEETLTHTANIFCDHWFIAYGIPIYIRTENGTQIVRKIIATNMRPHRLYEIRNNSVTYKDKHSSLESQ